MPLYEPPKSRRVALIWVKAPARSRERGNRTSETTSGIALLEGLEKRLMLAAVFWDGGAGNDNWHNPLNWSNDALPTSADDVMIADTALPEIRLQSAVSIRSLTTSENVRVGSSQLQISENATINADLVIGSSGRLNFAGPTDQSLGGSGRVVLTGQSFSMSQISLITPHTLTIGENMTIRGGWGMLSNSPNALSRIVNYGTISADISGQHLLLLPQTPLGFVNYGRLEALSGTIDLSSTGTGTIDLQPEGSLSSVGGVITLTGVLDNTDGVIALDDSTGSITLNRGTIRGGIVTATGSAGLTAAPASNQSTLDGVVLHAPLIVASATVIIKNGLELGGTISLTGASGILSFQGSTGQLLSGEGSISLLGGGTMRAQSLTLTIGTGITIHGGSGRLDSIGGGAFVNRGTIVADTAGQTITIQTFGQNFSNEGTLQATAGGTVSIATTVMNSGVVCVEPGSVLAIAGNLSQTPDALIHIGIAGRTSTLFGRVTVTGNVALGGSLAIHYDDGYVPDRGDSFHLISSTGTSGVLVSTDIPLLSDATLKSPVLVDAMGVRLIVTHIADWNNDLSVNVADIFHFLSSWFAGQGDFDGNGTNEVPDIFTYLASWFAAA